MTKLAGMLEECDSGAGIPFIRIDGSTDGRDRLLVQLHFAMCTITLSGPLMYSFTGL